MAETQLHAFARLNSRRERERAKKIFSSLLVLIFPSLAQFGFAERVQAKEFFSLLEVTSSEKRPN